MKSAFSYVSSFITSVLLIFTLLGSAGCIAAEKYASPQALSDLTVKQGISELVYKDLEEQFKNQSAVTGVPANAYMDAVDTEYLQFLIDDRINYGFSRLSNKYSYSEADRISGSNEAEKALRSSVHDFFEQYAKDTGYVIKDNEDQYFKKLNHVQDDALKLISESCDVFKMNTLDKHGVLTKVKPLFSKLPFLRILCLGASAFLALLLVVFNFKAVKDTLYWIGASGLISGIILCIPCIYLLNTNYFAAFTIKQAAIFKAYTSAMTQFTESLRTASFILLGIGVLLIVIYTICNLTSKKKAPIAEADTNT